MFLCVYMCTCFNSVYACAYVYVCVSARVSVYVYVYGVVQDLCVMLMCIYMRVIMIMCTFMPMFMFVFLCMPLFLFMFMFMSRIYVLGPCAYVCVCL